MKRPRSRRWMLHSFTASMVLIGLGVGVLKVCDQAWEKVKSFARSVIPDPFFEDPAPKKPKGKNVYGFQNEKLENEDEYNAFIASLELKYISPWEVVRPHRNILNGVKNELPPKKYWDRLSETLKVADAIREELGVPLKVINSAYRSPDYNTECSGAVANSYHTKNLALDLVYACSTEEAAKAARKLRDEGLFKGGIGIYSTFIHIDTRGRNANWGKAA